MTALVKAATRSGDSPVPYVGRYASTLGAGIFGLATRGQESQMRAMGSMGTLFAIVNSLAEATSQVEWHLYRQAESGDPDERQEVTSHAALDMWNNPNDFMEQAEFIETFQQHYDLVGEAWWVVETDPRFKVPLHLWPVRPDRMQPVPDPQKYLTGYLYTGPDGEQVALERSQVIFMRRPNPLDIYRGMGPVQTVMADIDSDRYSAEWNRNFFLNSAEPGGIIQFEEELDDTTFNRLRLRWAEQHKGVAQAHRVALLEAGGKWVERKYTNRDMQFEELRKVPGEKVREAFAYPKPMLGSVDDVNRANMEAANTIFAQWKSVPRLNRIRTTLNSRLLPMFGATAKGLEFDYDSPVPADREADDRERKSKAEAYKILTDAGVHPEDAAEVVGLPKMRVTLTRPAEPEPPTEEEEEFEAIADRLRGELEHRPLRALPAAQDTPDLPDITPLKTAHDAAMAQLERDWQPVQAAQIDAIAAQVRELVDTGMLAGLPEMTVPTEQAEQTLTAAMTQLGQSAAEQVVAEAAGQDVEIDPVPPAAEVVEQIAQATVEAAAADVVADAAAEAQRLAAPGVPGREVADAVRTYLEAQTGARLRGAPVAGLLKWLKDRLSGALHKSQHQGRAATLRAAPTAAYYGSEINDANRCAMCKEVDGRWLGNTLAEAEAEYPDGHYTRCLGRERCRGAVVAVWRGGADRSEWIEKEPV